MGLFSLKIGKVEIPLYDLAAIAAGFYIGYKEGKGINVKPSLEYACKYGPTVFATVLTPILIKAHNSFGNFMVRGARKNLELKSPQLEKKLEALDNLENKLKNPKYFKPTLRISARTAIETIVGYVAGRLYGAI